MKPLPANVGNVVIRTDFSEERIWDDIRALISRHTDEGLLTTVRIVDDPGYAGLTAERLLGLLPQDDDCVYLAVADARTSAPGLRLQDRTLLVVDAASRGTGPVGVFRTRLSDLPSVDANLSLANMEFGEFQESVRDNAAHPDPWPGPAAGRPPVSWDGVDDRPVLTGLAPGDTVRRQVVSSPSGTYVLLNQDDGDVVIRRVRDGAVVWRTGTRLDEELTGLSSRLVLRESGDLVLFDPTGVRLWSSGTTGRGVRRVVLGDDGRLALLDAEGGEVWSSARPGPEPGPA
ncbi:hypothetical protein [Streptomyces sp. NPDC049916]|uniref:DUF6924 domain-containing protein n=1 Tax=Streptomyces sp. NPDC049916 TaxID=3155156 RepID=UPI00343B422B